MKHPGINPPNPNPELSEHRPLLIRWGTAWLMVMAALAALTIKGKGDMNTLATIAMIGLWLLCSWKAGRSAFTLLFAWLGEQGDDA